MDSEHLNIPHSPGAGIGPSPVTPFATPRGHDGIGNDRVREYFDAILRLPPNWDSYNAAQPDPQIVQAAKIFWNNLAAGNVAAPVISPTRDGGVQFEWTRGQRYLEIELVDTKNAVWLFKDKLQRYEKEGSLQLDEPTEEVLSQLRNFAKSVE